MHDFIFHINLIRTQNNVFLFILIYYIVVVWQKNVILVFNCIDYLWRIYNNLELVNERDTPGGASLSSRKKK